MKITRQNYEYWFIDFIEGNLMPGDEVLVREFVQLNPDLYSELENLMDFKLIPEQTKFRDKDLLKQNSFKAITGITKFERLSIAYLENELNSKEQNELDRLLIHSDKKKKEFQLIQKTKLIADNNTVYSKKNSLKKLLIVKNKTKNYNFIYRVAAVFVLLAGLTFLLNQKNKTGLTGKKLTKIESMHQFKRTVKSKKTDVLHFNDNIAVVFPEKNKTEIGEIRKAVDIPKELVAYKCNALNNDIIIPGSDNFVERIYNSSYALNRKYKKEEIVFEEKIKNKINFTQKSLFAKSKAYVKKRFNYKKSYTDDGHMLIAFNIGDYKYKIDKKQKK